jgi:ATP-dependent helicase HepA
MQALDAGWDLLVVDEAHHLEWSPERSSSGYRLVESLAARTPGVLLLTATPQQLGPEGHFARLRLLDPERYTDLQQFLQEAEHYEAVASAVERIIEGRALTEEDRAFFSGHSERVRRHLDELTAGMEGAGDRLIRDLLDGFGTGRVMFRNTRSALSGFPERKALLVPIEVNPQFDATTLKVRWLAGLLRELPDRKLLLICHSRELAEQIHSRLPHEINVSAALFHEGLTLLQRDRNASYFADEEGARILICSEIGSEGRNFQFAHHLVLFDLPCDPELLEQRIGRLDRIGQRATVMIHVPYLPGTESEVLARWYHEGLDAFEKNLHGAAEIVRAVEEDLRSLLARFDAGRLLELIERSRQERQRVAEKLEHGYDRLLQLNSNRPERARELARQIQAADGDRAFEAFVVRLFEHYGVHVEELASRTYLFRPDYLTTDAFPTLPDEGLAVTFDRARALSREELGFMTWDHPLVRSVIELMVDGEEGNAAFGVWNVPGREALLLEVCSIVECVAPAALHVDRFLPPTPVRIVVDHELCDRTGDPELAAAHLRNRDLSHLLDREEMKSGLFPAMLDNALALATDAMEKIVSDATAAMNDQMREEIERLEDLHQINSHVTLEEIAALRERRSALADAIASARLRVGALKFILRTP